MWLFAMFDLPVTTREKRKAYARFRKALLRRGFTMLQFSVYGRYCPSEEVAESFKRAVREELPCEGQVRLLMVTERQFIKQEVWMGQKTTPKEDPPEQLLLF
jgi:CRISPR-associated protein Cas2